MEVHACYEDVRKRLLKCTLHDGGHCGHHFRLTPKALYMCMCVCVYLNFIQLASGLYGLAANHFLLIVLPSG